MKLASLSSCSRNLQLTESLNLAQRSVLLAIALLAIGFQGCSNDDRFSEISSELEGDGDLSNPPLTPPYLTDLKEGEAEGVAMRFGEAAAGKAVNRYFACASMSIDSFQPKI